MPILPAGSSRSCKLGFLYDAFIALSFDRLISGVAYEAFMMLWLRAPSTRPYSNLLLSFFFQSWKFGSVSLRIPFSLFELHSGVPNPA